MDKEYKEYLTSIEAAAYTGISRSQLAKLRQSGRGCEYIRIGEGKTKAIIRYRRSDLDKWLSNNRIKTSGGF